MVSVKGFNKVTHGRDGGDVSGMLMGRPVTDVGISIDAIRALSRNDVAGYMRLAAQGIKALVKVMTPSTKPPFAPPIQDLTPDEQARFNRLKSRAKRNGPAPAV